MNAEEAVIASADGKLKSTAALVGLLLEGVEETASRGCTAYTFKVPESISYGVIDAAVSEMKSRRFIVHLRLPDKTTIFVSWSVSPS